MRKSRLNRFWLNNSVIVLVAEILFCLLFFTSERLYAGVFGKKYPEVKEAGDGRLTDFGPDEAINRYVLELGLINLNEPGSRTYKVQDLPEVNLAIGLDIRSLNPNVILEGNDRSNPIIGIRVVNEKDKVVIDEKEALKDWAWSTGYLWKPYYDGEEGPDDKHHRFVYRDGSWKETMSKEGVITSIPVNIKSDGGWGTYFRPRRRGIYVITVQIFEKDIVSRDLEVRLRAKGGGWK